MSAEKVQFVFTTPTDYVFVALFGIAFVSSLVQTVFRIQAYQKRKTRINLEFAILLVAYDTLMCLHIIALVLNPTAVWSICGIGYVLLTVAYIWIQIEVLELFLGSLGYSERFILILRVSSVLIHFVCNAPLYVINFNPAIYDQLLKYNVYSLIWYFWDIALDMFISIKLSIEILKSTQVWGAGQSQASVKRTLIGGCVLVAIGYMVTAAAQATHLDPYLLLTGTCYALHYIVGTAYLPLLASFSSSMRNQNQSGSNLKTVSSGNKSAGSSNQLNGTVV